MDVGGALWEVEISERSVSHHELLKRRAHGGAAKAALWVASRDGTADCARVAEEADCSLETARVRLCELAASGMMKKINGASRDYYAEYVLVGYPLL